MYCTIYWNKLVLGAISIDIIVIPMYFFFFFTQVILLSGEFPGLWFSHKRRVKDKTGDRQIRNKAIFGGTLRPPIYISIISWITIFHSIVSITFISFYFSYWYFIRTYIWFVILQLHFELLQQSPFSLAQTAAATASSLPVTIGY